MYDILPLNEKNFDFSSEGATTGLKYEGRFKCKCVLDIAGKHALELEKTKFMADFANPTNGLQGIALTIATIRAKLIEWPSWWSDHQQGLTILDENIVLEIYDALVDAENAWRASLLKKAEEARTANDTLSSDEDQKGNVQREN